VNEEAQERGLNIAAVVPTIGRVETLPLTLNSIVEQDYPVDKLFLIDEADTTVLESYAVNQILDLMSHDGIEIHIIRNRWPSGIGAARVLAGELAGDDACLMLDDDVAMRSGCLAYLVEALKEVSSANWATPYCYLIGGRGMDGYIDTEVSPTDPKVQEWTSRYSFFIPYYDYGPDNKVIYPVAGTQAILFRRGNDIPEKAKNASYIGKMPREDTYITLVTGPGVHTSNAHCIHIEHPNQIGRNSWGETSFYRLHEAVIKDPETWVTLFRK